MNRNIIAPLSVLAGILGILALAGTTHVFSPVVAFIHNWNAITPAGTAACILFTVAGFWAALMLLHIICRYFVPRLEDKPGYENGSSPR